MADESRPTSPKRMKPRGRPKKGAGKRKAQFTKKREKIRKVGHGGRPKASIYFSIENLNFFLLTNQYFFSATNQPQDVEAEDSRQAQPETQPETPEPTSQTERKYP